MELNASVDSLEIKDENIKQDIDEEVILQSEVPFHLLQYVPFSLNGSKLQNVCRICLNTIKQTKISLLAVHNNNMLINMLRLLTAVQVGEMYPDEDLPSNICESCLSDIIYCYEFKVKFEKSQSILQSLLKNKIAKEVPLDTVKSEDSELPIEDNCVIKDEIKEEIIIEDIEEEYLEDLNDLSSGNEELCIVQNPDNYHKELNACTTKATLINNFKSIAPSTKKSSGKPYSCIFCLKKYDRAKQLRAHVTKRHSAEDYSHSCDRCKEVFSSEHDLHVHSSVHTTGPKWSCNKCEKAFKARSQLRRHIQRHMQSKRFACESCDKAFSELYALRRHMRVHTGEALEKKFACQLCDKRFIENNQLTAHAAWHSGERRCVCVACGKAFASARLLASHRLVHSDLKPYACTYCDKRFRHESTRNTHHRTHTGEKPYVCATCGKTFIQNSNLTLHMRTHTGERPYSCDKCDRKFTTGSSLKAHQRRHTGEKPYSCNVCGKKFARRDLSAHMRQHTGERPHACSACPKRFASAARLRDHTRMHTGEKPFECASCTQTFSTKSHLVKHLKKHQAKKKRDKRGVVMVQQMDYRAPVFKYEDKYIIADGEQLQVSEQNNKSDDIDCEIKESNITLELTPEVPLEVTSELMVQDDCNVKEILVVDNSQNDANYQSGNICINTDGVNYVNSDVNLVAVNEGTTVYHLDQSLVQIHSSGGQVTISKITSKMTANF